MELKRIHYTEKLTEVLPEMKIKLGFLMSIKV